MGTLKAFLIAATAALRAFPLWLAWMQAGKLEKFADEIIILESRSLSDERANLDRLRVKYERCRKQNAALLAVISASFAGAVDPDK